MARHSAAEQPSPASTSKDKVSSVNCIYSPMTHLQQEGIQKKKKNIYISIASQTPLSVKQTLLWGRKILPDFGLIAQFGCAEASNYPSQCSIKEAAFLLE